MLNVMSVKQYILLTGLFCQLAVRTLCGPVNVQDDGPSRSLFGASVVDMVNTIGLTRLQDHIQKYLGLELQYDTLFSSAETYANASEECIECLDMVELGNTIIDLGYEFEDLRDLGVAVCEDFFSVVNPPAVIICPGAVDIHAYHLYRVFADRDVSSEHACLVWNECLETEIQPDVNKEEYIYKTLPETELQERPDVSVSNSSIKVLHISDIHMDHQYKEGSPVDCGLMTCCRPYWPGAGSAGRWGDYTCNTPIRTITAMLTQLEALKPDFVLYTGDNAPHTPWNDSISEKKEIGSFIASQLTRHFPGIPIYATIGNHESFPTNHYKLGLNESREFNEGFIEWWRRASRFGEEQAASIRRGMYFTTRIQRKLRILSYNTQYAHTQNLYVLHTIQDQEYRDMKAFMRNTLQKARQDREKVVMISHHPAGTEHFTVDFGRFITELCREYSDIIVLHVFGHWHKDEFRLFLNPDSGRADGVQMMMSSVTPKGGGNPTARILYLDPQNFTVIDYDNYNMAIAPETPGRPVLRSMYRFTEEYNLPDASPDSLRVLTDRMVANRTILEQFWNNRQGRSGREGVCAAGCQKTLLCRLRNTVYDQYHTCLNS